MLDTSNNILRALATDLACRLTPAHWDLGIAEVVRALATVAGDRDLAESLRPVAPLLEGTSSGVGLDLAYGSPDAPTDLRSTCERLEVEILTESSWFEHHPESWAASHGEFLDVVAEFAMLVGELRRMIEVAS
mgnify:CR=1 FL=1